MIRFSFISLVRLCAAGIMSLTSPGHGGRTPDLDGDEDDGMLVR